MILAAGVVLGGVLVSQSPAQAQYQPRIIAGCRGGWCVPPLPTFRPFPRRPIPFPWPRRTVECFRAPCPY